MIKYIKQFGFNYWCNKRLDFDLYWLIDDKDASKKQLKLTIWEVHKIPEYDDGWYSSWWKHFVLWKLY